jgi:hypothetical protein
VYPSPGQVLAGKQFLHIIVNVQDGSCMNILKGIIKMVKQVGFSGAHPNVVRQGRNVSINAAPKMSASTKHVPKLAGQNQQQGYSLSLSSEAKALSAANGAAVQASPNLRFGESSIIIHNSPNASMHTPIHTE